MEDDMGGPNELTSGLPAGQDSSQNVGPNDTGVGETPPKGAITGLHENHANTGVPFESGSPWGQGANGGTG